MDATAPGGAGGEMATIDIEWAETEPFNVAEEARRLGFDLRMFASQPEEVRAAIRKMTVDRIVRTIREAWREAYDHDYKDSQDFNRIANGVYVIAIGGGFAVDYRDGTSEVMYIGRGRIANRLRSHLANWIFEMSLSLKEVPFRFYMESVGDGRSPEAFKDLEHLMLHAFSAKFGEKPHINKIHGREGTIDHRFNGDWRRPFDNRGRQVLWTIRPSRKNAWFRELRDD